MNLILMEESSNDFSEISDLLKKASLELPPTFQNAHKVIDKLRQSEAYIPRLSIVAKRDGMVVGHIALTKALVSEKGCDKTCLFMSSHHVLPSLQNAGIGAALLKSIHLRAEGLGYKCIVLSGYIEYYKKFGYRLTDKLSIEVPLDGVLLQPFIKELIPGTLLNLNGPVELPTEYGFSSYNRKLI